MSRLEWKPVDENPPEDGGASWSKDEYLVCWTDAGGEVHFCIDRWLGSMWKHTSPEFWAVMPVPTELE